MCAPAEHNRSSSPHARNNSPFPKKEKKKSVQSRCFGTVSLTLSGLSSEKQGKKEQRCVFLLSLSLPCGWSSHRRETKTRDQSSGGGRDGSECPTSPASGMFCVCASERTQPTGAPLLSGAFSRKRVPASPLSRKYSNLIINVQRLALSFPPPFNIAILWLHTKHRITFKLTH